ncbi:hypothetical protein D3C74_390500 [compost metagenome]
MIKFQQFNIGILFGEISFSRCSFGYDQLLAFLFQLVDRSDRRTVRRYNTKGQLHVGTGKIHFFFPLIGNCKIGHNDIHFIGFEIGYTACRIHQHKFGFRFIPKQVLGKSLGNVHVKSLILPFGIHIAKWRLIRKYTNSDLIIFLQLFNGSKLGRTRIRFSVVT